MAKTIEVAVSELKDSFYVRVSLNQDHVLYLMGLIDGGVDVGPIRITEDLRIIDGRHRAEAYNHLGIPMIKAIVESDGSALTLIGKAIGANVGGALPPTRRDLQHAIAHLVKQGIGRDKITEELSQFLPKSFIRVAYQQAVSDIHRQRIRKAIQILSENPGLTIKKVGELVGVEPKFIQDAITKVKEHDSNGKWLSSIKQGLSSRYTHFNKSNGKLVQKIFRDFDDGEISEKELSGAVGYLGQLITNQNRIWQDWDKRWKARTK